MQIMRLRKNALRTKGWPAARTFLLRGNHRRQDSLYLYALLYTPYTCAYECSGMVILWGRFTAAIINIDKKTRLYTWIPF